jgi:hypothetical protein
MRFDHDDDEQPATVARVMADFALALILILVMLVGTRSPLAGQTDPRAAARAATLQPEGKQPDLNLALTEAGKFLRLPSTGGNADKPIDGAALASEWMASNARPPGTVVIHFPPGTLASDLHRALLELQGGFGTNSVSLQTIPISSK